MKFNRGSVLPVAGIALVIGLFAWAWVGTARHHSGTVHMGYAVQQMPDEVQNGTMPMGAMRDVNMASMHEAMVDDGTPITQMPMTANHLDHMKSMGMGSMDMGGGGDAGHRDHHRAER